MVPPDLCALRKKQGIQKCPQSPKTMPFPAPLDPPAHVGGWGVELTRTPPPPSQWGLPNSKRVSTSPPLQNPQRKCCHCPATEIRWAVGRAFTTTKGPSTCEARGACEGAVLGGGVPPSARTPMGNTWGPTCPWIGARLLVQWRCTCCVLVSVGLGLLVPPLDGAANPLPAVRSPPTPPPPCGMRTGTSTVYHRNFSQSP